MAKQSRAQKKTVERVMHEFKHGELRIRGSGPKVKNPRQAIAIALREAGASKYESPKKNAKNLERTKRKEARGQTALAEKEGRRSLPDRRKRGAAGKGGKTRDGTGKTKAELYAQAKRRNIPGRSRMDKRELERALAK